MMYKTILFSFLFTITAPTWAANTDYCQFQIQQVFAPSIEYKAEGHIDRRTHDAQFNTLGNGRSKKIQSGKFFKDSLYLNNGFVAKEQNYAERLIDKRERDNYFNSYEQSRHKIYIKDGLVYNSEGKLLDTHDETRIYIMDENLDIFIVQEEFLAPGRSGKHIHHSHLSRGNKITASGQIKISNGLITYADNRSGHYSPELPFLGQFRQVLLSLKANLSKTLFSGFLQGPVSLSSNGTIIEEKLPATLTSDFSRKEIAAIKRQNELNKVMEILVIPLHDRTKIEEEFIESAEKELRIDAMQTLINYGIKFFTE